MPAPSASIPPPALSDIALSKPACDSAPTTQQKSVPDDHRWDLPMFRAGILATLFFQIAYLLQALKAGREGQLVLDLHALLVGLPAFVIGLTWWKSFQRHWRQVLMALSIVVIGAMAALAVATGEMTPCFIVSILFLAGSSLFTGNEYCQEALSAAVLFTFAIVETFVPSSDLYEFVSRLGLLTVVGITQIALRLSSGYRRSMRLHLEELKSAQTQSSQSEATIRQVLDAIPGLVLLTRLHDGKLLEVNQEFLERTGFSREKVLSGSTREIGLYARAEDRAALTRKLQKERTVRELEIDFRLNKILVPYLVSAVVIDFQGEACTVLIGQDIARIKDSERTLRETQERLNVRIEELTVTQERLHAEIVERKIVDRIALERENTLHKIFRASPDHITIRRLRDGRYLQINKEISLTGYRLEELLGKCAEDLKVFANPAQYAEFKRRLLSDGELRDMEVEFRHKDGRILYGLVSATVVELGGEPCAISISRDMSKSKRNEHALRAAQERLNLQIRELTAAHERLRAEVADRKAAERIAKEREDTLRRILESTTDGLVIFSLGDGHIIETNSEFSRASGYSREELLAAPQGRIGTWAQVEQRRCFIRQMRAAGVVRNMEVEMRSRNGALSPLLVSGSLVELNGESCAVVLIRNITEIKRTHDELRAAREQALAASRSKSEFLSSMSHEIRTPMNAILGMADILSDTALDTDQRGYLQTMRSNGTVLLSLIDDILDLAKVESGRLQLETVDFDLSELIAKVAETLAPRAHGKGLELVARIVPGTPLWVVGDPLRLRQVLMNLLGNAIKFTELGEVVFTVRPDEGLEAGLLHFSVADTGIGIDRDEVDEIFSEFTQADSSTTRKYGGSGLGLAIARRLVGLMGGRIWVESERGKGSTFHFIARLRSSDRAFHNPAQRDLRGMRALVADRSSNSRLIFKEILEPYGAAIVEVDTAQAMAATLHEAARTDRPFDLAFADYQMPGIDRVTQLATTGREWGAQTLIPMITTDNLRGTLEGLRQLGVHTSLRKPVSRSALLEIAWHAVATLESDHPELTIEAHAGTPMAFPPVESFMPGAPKCRLLLADDSPDNRLVISAYLKRLPCEIEVAENGSVAVAKFIRDVTISS